MECAGVAREMAALLLGRLLTRPDMRAALSEFLDWTEQALAAPETIHSPFLVPGVLVHMHGLRNQLGRHAQFSAVDRF